MALTGLLPSLSPAFCTYGIRRVTTPGTSSLIQHTPVRGTHTDLLPPPVSAALSLSQGTGQGLMSLVAPKRFFFGKFSEDRTIF